MHSATARLDPLLRLRNQALRLERQAASALAAGCLSQDPQAIERIRSARLAFDRRLSQLVKTLGIPSDLAALPPDLSHTPDPLPR